MKMIKTIEFKIMLPFLLLVLIPCLAVGATAGWEEFKSYKNERFNEAEAKLQNVISYLDVLEHRVASGELQEEQAKKFAKDLMLREESHILIENSNSYSNQSVFPYEEQPQWWKSYLHQSTGKYKRPLGGRIDFEEEWVMIYHVYDWNWTIVIPFTFSYFAEPLISIQKNTLLVMIIAAIIAVQITIMLSYHFSRPLKTLASFCQAQGQGDKLGETEIFLTRNDEIGVLTHSIKEMLDNIEEKKQLEKKMEKIERLALMGQMASEIAHEIRNPLAGIKTTTQVLSSRLELDEKNQVLFQGVTREIDRVNRTITNLLNLARPRDPQFKVISPYEVVNQIFILLEKESIDKNIFFINRISKELNYFVDPDHFKQIMINITLNALNAMENGGEIIFSSASRGGLFIEDKGKGIAKEDLDKIFDPFYTTSSSGTGLGLSMVHQMVLQNNGEIDIQSELSRGTTFILHFPQERGE